MTLKPPQDFHTDSNFTLTGSLQNANGATHRGLPGEEFPIGPGTLAERLVLGRRLRVRCTVRLPSRPQDQSATLPDGYRAFANTNVWQIAVFEWISHPNQFIVPDAGKKNGRTQEHRSSPCFFARSPLYCSIRFHLHRT